MNELVNFRKTLRQLQNFLALPVQNDRDRAGIIQAFEFTFEQCWKAIQKKAGHDGVEIASPKKAFSFALSNNWIDKDKETLWLRMLDHRNMTSHTYKEDIANELLHRIIKDYAPAFESLLKKMELEK